MARKTINEEITSSEVRNIVNSKIEDLLKRDIVEKSKSKTSKKISEIKPLPMPTYNEFYERVITTGKNFAYLICLLDMGLIKRGRKQMFYLSHIHITQLLLELDIFFIIQLVSLE